MEINTGMAWNGGQKERENRHHQKYKTKWRTPRASVPYNKYSKHPHIRTLILEVRLIRFLYIGCLVKNQPEGVLKLFLKIGGGNQNCNKYIKKKPEIKLAYLM